LAARDFTGDFRIDDAFLASEGVTDFDQYRIGPTKSRCRTSSEYGVL